MADLAGAPDAPPQATNGVFPATDAAGQTVAAIAQAETVSAGTVTCSIFPAEAYPYAQMKSLCMTVRFVYGASKLRIGELTNIATRNWIKLTPSASATRTFS